MLCLAIVDIAHEICNMLIDIDSTNSWLLSKGEPSLSALLPVFGYRNLFALFLLYWLLDIAYNCTFHPLRNVPGPRLAKFSESWRQIRYFRGSWHTDILDVHRRYGAVVRIAPNEVSFVDTAALKDIYGPWKNIEKVC